MRFLILLLAALALAACSFKYTVDVPQDADPAEVATLHASFFFRISEIDRKPFEQNYQLLAEGTNTILMSPGHHSFRFRYCNCSVNAQVYTTEDSYLDGVFEAGRHYELYGTGDGGRIEFAIREIAAPAAK